MKTTRFTLLVMAFAIVSLLMVACGAKQPAPQAGDTSSQAGGQQQTPASGTSADKAKEENKAAPKTVKHKYGETTIPAAPKRIVSFNLEDMLLTLDIPLVLAAPHGENYYLEPKLKQKNIPMTLWSADAISFEAIVAANPDLIVATEAINQNAYEQMSKIAPTIVFNRDNWRSSIVDIGKALGIEDKANAIVKGYDDKVKKAKESIVQSVGPDKTVAFLRASAKTLQLYFPTYAAGGSTFSSYVGVVYNDLGLKPIAKVTELAKASPDKQNALISQEVLPELNPDYLFVTVGGSVGSSDVMRQNDNEYADLQKLGLWQAIPAVQQGRVYKVSAQHWISNGPIADEMKVNDIVAALQKK